MIHKKSLLLLNRRTVYLLPLLLAFCGWSACKTEAPSGRDNTAINQQRGGEIVAEYLKRDAAPYRKSRVRMTIVSPSEPQKVYELEIWRKQSFGETLTLTHVVSPAEESDLAALSIERKDTATVNVSFVSSTGQFRETGTEKMFFGGLTAQELLGEWDKYDYALKEEKDLNGIRVYDVEGTLKSLASSTIARTRTLFRSDTYMPAEFHLFNSAGEELRTFQVKNYRNVSGHDVCWLTEIDNHARQTKVTIESLSVEYPQQADDSIFTREHVKQLALKR
ncbi:MAG TPA: outer membrane lipoprotein-sorting protein [Pyrinomonadaceae bacterium]|nr:outer membrane lipoprotein-sorting protein [Pyrinomonadaceae bacterium]